MTTAVAESVSPEILAELQKAARYATSGIRDPQMMRTACDQMDLIREDIRRQHGVLDIGTPAIRELRDQ